MVRLVKLATLALLPAVTFAQLATLEKLQDAGKNVVKTFLTKVVGMNETQLDKAMSKEPAMAPHPYAVDLRDDNWQQLLRSGTDENALAPSLPEDTIWVIAVYAQDQFSKLFMKGFNDVVTFNSSESGGKLPENMHFGRLDYGAETILPTKLWLWKVPVLIIATNQFKDLRFFKLGQVSPFQDRMAALLNDDTIWTKMPVWRGSMAPGGSLEPFVEKLGNGWAYFHYYFSRIPNFVILIISGMTMNVVVGMFHKPTAPAQPAAPAQTPATGAKKAETVTESTDAPSSTSTGTKGKGKAVKRK